MRLSDGIFIVFVINLWKNDAFTEKIAGLDVLLVDMENYDSTEWFNPFINCLFGIFDFHYGDAHCHVGIVCATLLGNPKIDGYYLPLSKNAPVVSYKCLATYGNGDLDSALTKTRQIVKDTRKNASLITLVVTGANLRNTDLDESNKKFFHDEPNMLIVITHTDVVISADIARITGNKDRTINFGTCSEEIKNMFPELLCQPPSREGIVGNCSYDNISQIYQRKIFGMPLIQSADIVCPGRYPAIIKIENCSAIDNQTNSALSSSTISTSDNHNHPLYGWIIPLVVLCVAATCLTIGVAFVCWKKHKKPPKKQTYRRRINSQVSFTTENQPTTSEAHDQKPSPNQPTTMDSMRSILGSGRGFGKSTAETSFQHGEKRSMKKAHSKMHVKAKS